MGAVKIAAFVMLVCLMLQSGMQTDLAHLREVLKNYSLLTRALIANFVLVPLFAVIVTRILHLNDSIATGIMLMAVAAGVPFLARAAGRKAGGSLGFALALCFLMPAISIFTAPLTARLILPVSTAASFPVKTVIVTLIVAQLIPLLVGIAVNQKAPQVAEKLIGPLAIVVTVAMVVVLVLAAPAIGKAVATIYGSLGAICAFVVVMLSLAAGWLLGGPELPYRNTLALATALRNPGMALVVATTNFAGTLVPAMVITYFLVQVIVGVAFGKVFANLAKGPQAPAAATPV